MNVSSVSSDEFTSLTISFHMFFFKQKNKKGFSFKSFLLVLPIFVRQIFFERSDSSL